MKGTSIKAFLVDALAAEIERVRADADFAARAKKLLARDKALLERLGPVTRYLTLAEYLCLAEHVTGVPASVLANASRVDLAESALHAPAAGFGDEDFYPDVRDKAAVLTCRLSWNHPLPDGLGEPCVVCRPQQRSAGSRPA